MGKKATLLDIIEKKRKQGNDDKVVIRYYHSDLLDMDIEIRKLRLAEYLDYVEEYDNAKGGTGNLESMNKLIFHHCPMFQVNTKEAMETYGLEEAIQLPSAVLNEQVNEIRGLMKEINKLYGVDKLEAEIKN